VRETRDDAAVAAALDALKEAALGECVAVVLQWCCSGDVVCCSALLCVAVVMQCDAMCCGVSQCVAACCSVLQWCC